MSPESELNKHINLDRDTVLELAELIRELRTDWGKGELKCAVFEQMVDLYELPFVEVQKNIVPDPDDPRVEELERQFDEFSDVFEVSA